MPYQEQLADRLRIALTDHNAVEERKMFGGLCIMKRGHMFCGVMGEEFMFRVGADQMDHALALPGARQVQFGNNRPMTGFVFVAAQAVAGAVIDDWIAMVDGFNQTLPPKTPKPAK